MAQLLYFRNQQIGDGVVLTEALDAPQTPPVSIVGVFRGAARLDTSSRNFLYSQLVRVFLKRTDNLACDAAIAAIRANAGLTGTVRITNNGTPRFTAANWVLMTVEAANLAAAFGGRFAPGLTLVFAGETAPVRV